MKNVKHISPKSIALSLTLSLALTAGAFASGDFSSYLEGTSKGSMADLVSGLRSGSAAVPAPKAPEAGPAQPQQTGNNELLHFWEDLKEDVFDDICKDVEIPIDAGFDIGDIVGIDGKYKRYMKQYPDNKIAVIDEVRVKLDAGHTFSDIFSVDGNSFNIGLSGSLEGKSIVVRKTEEDRYCKNLLKLADLRTVKTILPMSEKRIKKMKVNEIWKFPARLHMGISGGIGYPVQPWASISFSLGTYKDMKPSVTLFRMSEDKLRMRIRLDRITVKHIGASGGTSFDAGMIGLSEAEGFLMKELNKEIVKEFNKYLAVKFGLSRSRAKGQKILLEFVLDPRNDEQIGKLVDFLRGDLGIIRKLIEMGVEFNDFSEGANTASGQASLDAVSQVADEELGLNTTFAGSNHFNSDSHSWNAMLPIIVHHESGKTQRYDRYQAAGSEEVLHVHSASKRESNSNINIPIIGKIFKHNTNQNFYVVNNEDKDGSISDASVVYQRYEGYIKHEETSARGMIENMNEILKYAGTQGDGVNNDFVVDTDELFPRLADGGKSKRYKSAILSFSLVFTKQAVRDIVVTPAVKIMKAVFNIMEGVDREIIGKIYHLFSIDANNKVKYDWKAARRILYSYETDEFDPFDTVRNFCYNVSRIVTDIASVNTAGGQKDKARRLSEVLGGKGKSRVGYENMLQIVIQLAKTEDIYAKLNFRTDKRIKGEENINTSYSMYNTELSEGYNSQLSAANSLRDRFSNPSVLSD